uniref:replication protein A 70 kDa DNA-binding subunit A-like n=1 Tax=Erigeron canadensis TaxID=72917 RepID=UPI001CB9873D|nr:replication protein A 70 kDa DNA-binding subunit A-like [Erigeron canadensis]
MEVKLTEGSITVLSSKKWQELGVKPVLQLYQIRLLNSQPERYGLVLSDGLRLQQGMLAIQLNHLVKSERLNKGSVIQLKEFVCNAVRDRIIIIVTDLDVLHETYNIIGEPERCTSDPLIPAAPTQSNNQPATTVGSQVFMAVPQAGSVPPPNYTARTPDHSPGHGAGLQSYGNAPSNLEHVSSIYPRADSVTANSLPSAYTRPAQPTHNQPPPMYMNRGPIAKNEAPPRIIPIAALNPYQGRWTIKARVTAKSELRRYNNAKGDGKVFSFDLLDSDGGEIRTTCFNAVADQFYEQIEVGKVYVISKGNLKPAQKAFNHLKNDHEIMLDHTSTIQPCFDDDGSIPKQQFHFRPIAEIEGLGNNTILDIIGVVYKITPSASIQRKNGTETQKRTLELKDMSGTSVELTLWGNFCNKEGQTLQTMCDSGVFPVLAVKAARVNEFNGKSVGTIATSQICIEPDSSEALRLKAWYDDCGSKTTSVSLSKAVLRTDERKTISRIKDEKLGTSDKPDWITVSATVMHFGIENFCYTACPLIRESRQCSKKVTNNGDGKWRCDTCDQSSDECDYRYILRLQIQDHTGSTSVTAFQETGAEIMGVAAKELYYIKYEERDEERFSEIIRSVVHTKYNFTLKVKEETYNDDPSVKCTVSKVERIKFSSNTSFFLDFLKKDEHTSIGSKIENPVGLSAPFSNNIGSVGGLGRQAALQANQTGLSSMGNSGSLDRQAVLQANQTGHFGKQFDIPSFGMGCSSCGDLGHSTSGCPSVGNASGRANSLPSGGASGNCIKCNQPGHWPKDCPRENNVKFEYNASVAAGRYGTAFG